MSLGLGQCRECRLTGVASRCGHRIRSALTPLQTLVASAACGAAAGGFAYLETRLVVLAIPAAAVVALALARWLPRQPTPAMEGAQSRAVPWTAAAATGFVLVVGIVLAVSLSDWVIVGAVAGAIGFWLVLILLAQRR